MRNASVLISIIAIIMIISTASSLPEILDVFNREYNTSGTMLDTCGTCHIPGQFQNATNLNPYGMAVKSNLSVETNQAYKVIEPLDSDGDGFTNIDEIHNLTFPGNKSDFPRIYTIPSLSSILLTKEDTKNSRINGTETVATTANSIPIVTVPKITTQKISGFGIFASILSLFMLSKYRKK